MCLIPTTVDVQVVLVPNEGVVSPGCWGSLCGVYFQFNPLAQAVVELFDVIEIGASLSSIPSKKVDAVFVGDAVGAWTSSWGHKVIFSATEFSPQISSFR